MVIQKLSKHESLKAFKLWKLNKHESLPQIDTKIFRWVWSSIPKVSKITSLYCLYNVSKKEVKDEVEFLDADKHQSFLRVDFSTLGIKVFYKIIDMIMKMWRACWWAWSIILQSFKVLKVTSLQCLYNFTFPKKKLWMEFILDSSRSKLLQVGLSIFDESSQTCPKYPKKEVC